MRATNAFHLADLERYCLSHSRDLMRETPYPTATVLAGSRRLAIRLIAIEEAMNLIVFSFPFPFPFPFPFFQIPPFSFKFSLS